MLGTVAPLVRNVVERVSDEVWQLAELSFHEEASSRGHVRELEAAGFTVTSRGTGGISTAFVAEWTQGGEGPAIGFLPEYDALPGLGNARRFPVRSACRRGYERPWLRGGQRK